MRDGDNSIDQKIEDMMSSLKAELTHVCFPEGRDMAVEELGEKIANTVFAPVTNTLFNGIDGDDKAEDLMNAIVMVNKCAKRVMFTLQTEDYHKWYSVGLTSNRSISLDSLANHVRNALASLEWASKEIKRLMR